MKAGIHAIIQKTEKDAEQHGNERYLRIKHDVDAEIKKEDALYLQELGKRRESLKKQNEREYGKLIERIGSRLNREFLSYQHELIDEIFETAVSKLRGISSEEFTELLIKTVQGLSGNFTLSLGKLSEGKLDIQKMQEGIKDNPGLNISLSAERIPNKSGFVLMDDRVEYNCLFEDLIEDKKSEQAAAILKEVFGD